jgi:hypothetical protein
MEAEPLDPARRSVPWDLDSLDGDALHRAYSHLADFVDWLRRCDIAVPSCWYAHGWVVRRLAALRVWQDDAYVDGATGRDAAEWWRAGLMPLCTDWRDLIAHRGEHTSPDNPLDDPAPVPSMDEVVAELVAERAE